MGQLSDGLAALIRYANETTGESDTTLSDAVDSLVAGYGGGGGAYILIYSTSGALLSCGLQQYTLQSDETYHAFPVTAGTYTCTASKNQSVKTTNVTVTGDDVYIASLILHRLPDAYTEVEYIKSTGGQAINTGVQINSSLIVRSTLSFDVLPTSRTCLFGFDTGFYGLSLLYDGAWKMLYYDRYTNLAGTPIMAGGWYAMEMDTRNGAQSATLGDMTATDSYGVTISPLGNSIFLFATSINGTIGTPASMAMKETSLYNNGTLVRKLIPCVRDADGVVGMYDLVYNIFYTNIGTGAFIAGPAI